MKRDSYSNQQAHASFQPRSPQSAIDPTQLAQPVHHSSSTGDLGSSLGAKWLNKASGWVADKFQTAQSFVTSVNDSGDVIAPNQILPALRGTANRPLSQTDPTNQPLVGVIDSGFGAGEHGSKVVEAIQKDHPQAQIWKAGGVGTGGWSKSLVEFVDTAKASGHSRAVANLSFDLTEVHPDGSTSNRSQLTADEQSALAYARDNNVLIVASSGNQGGEMSALGQASQPSDNLIVVGAANGRDRASYSSYGKGLDLIAEVGAAGTSLAAAKVTETIAQLWSDNPGLSDRQINQTLTATATDLNKPGWDAETGAGLLNATGAIGLAKHTVAEPSLFSNAPLTQQVPGALGGATWESRDGAVASEQINFLMEGDESHPLPDAPRNINPYPRRAAGQREGERAPLPPQPASAINPLDEGELDEIEAQIERAAGQQAFGLLRQMEADLVNPPQSTPPPAQRLNVLDEERDRAERAAPAAGQVPIQQGDTLWDIAQEQLGSGDRWRELRQPDGSPFTEQEASRLQVGTSVQIPGTQPNPVGEDVNAALSAVAAVPVIGDLVTAPTTPASGQVPIQQGDTLWDIAQEQLGSGDRWRELRKPDGSPFTEQDASHLQVGTSVQIPGAQSAPIETPPPLPDLAIPPAPPPPAPAPNHVTDFFGSVGNKLWEAGEGAFETVTNPGQAVDDLVNSVHTIATDPGQALNSFAEPYLDAFNSGRYGDLAGQLAGDALLAVSPGGLAVRVNNVLGRLPDAPPPNIDGIGDERLTADSRNPELVAVGGGNDGTRPPVPSTAAAIPDVTTHDRNSRADSPPPQSGGSGGGNQPPQDPPTGGGGSPSSFDSEPNDPNKPPSTNGSGDTTAQGSQGLTRDAKGRLHDTQGLFARDPNKPKDLDHEARESASKALRDRFRRNALAVIKGDESHPLRFLIDEKGKWRTSDSQSEEIGVQAGHLTSNHSLAPEGYHDGAPERLALEDASFNWLDSRPEGLGAVHEKSAIEIGGLPVELGTAQIWEEIDLIPKGTVANARPHSGWTG